mmetsp:Transcript_87830/g.200710  ORF Transcript_87830/g.200710 Transcript_87830/m.200710 type:complete len:202 (-) Transcript_87830:269-874(-)
MCGLLRPNIDPRLALPGMVGVMDPRRGAGDAGSMCTTSRSSSSSSSSLVLCNCWRATSKAENMLAPSVSYSRRKPIFRKKVKNSSHSRRPFPSSSISSKIARTFLISRLRDPVGVDKSASSSCFFGACWVKNPLRSGWLCKAISSSERETAPLLSVSIMLNHRRMVWMWYLGRRGVVTLRCSAVGQYFSEVLSESDGRAMV